MASLSESDRPAEKARRTNDANFLYWNPRLRLYEQFSQCFVDERTVETDNVPTFLRTIQRRVSSDGLIFGAPELVI